MTTVTYNSVSNTSQGTVSPKVLDNGCSVTTTPSWDSPAVWPVNSVRTFEDYEETVSVIDPSKGRSFRKLKRSGEIAMSPYARRHEVTERYVSSRDYTSHHAAYWSTDKCSRTNTCATTGPHPVDTKWTQNDHIGSLSHLVLKGRTISSYDSDVRDLVSSTQQQAFANALNGYDVLTELAELRETAGYLLGKVKGGADLLSKLAGEDPEAWRRGRRLNVRSLSRSADQALKRLGGRWLEYRYAIMPLFYSIKDINEVYEKRNDRYHSERAKDKITLDSGFFVKTDNCLYSKLSGSIEVRSLTKARYDYGSLQRLASVIGVNPFRTAWELVPMSFVVDWFLNVGDAIASATSLDYSSQRIGCTSIRTKAVEEVHHYEKAVTGTVPWYWARNECGYQPAAWLRPWSATYDNIVQRTEYNNYERFLWNRPGPEIVFNPSMTWKRFIDALALSYQPTQKLLRSLR